MNLMTKSAATPCVSNHVANVSPRHRFARESVGATPDFPGRRRGEMRAAAQRVGVAIALQEIAPGERGLRLVDIEFH